MQKIKWRLRACYCRIIKLKFRFPLSQQQTFLVVSIWLECFMLRCSSKTVLWIREKACNLIKFKILSCSNASFQLNMCLNDLDKLLNGLIKMHHLVLFVVNNFID